MRLKILFNMYSVFIIEIPYPSKIRDNTSIKNSPPINQIYTHIMWTYSWEKYSPNLSFRPMHWEMCGNWSIFRHFLLLPLLLSPPPETRKKKKKNNNNNRIKIKNFDIYIYDIIFLSKSWNNNSEQLRDPLFYQWLPLHKEK